MLTVTGGYDGDALFENLELVRTVQAAGGRELHATGLYAPRADDTALPPSTGSAGDNSIAQPGRRAAS